MRRTLSVAAALVASLALAAPVGAITNGAPDGDEHEYVGEFLFYVPDAPSSRFSDPGSWFTCSGTLVSPTIVLTAGHCTFGVGLDSESTTDDGEITNAADGGVGGNDIWISFEEEPDFDILPPSATFTTQAARYSAWEAVLDGSSEWHRGTAIPHPAYDDLLFWHHDAGVVELAEPVTSDVYGEIAPPNWLNRYRAQPRNTHRFEAVGYGLERVQGKKDFGGDTRMQSHPKLNSFASQPADAYVVMSNNTATGGTCFGDSGGPVFDSTTSNVVVGVTSWGQSPNCGGKAGVYRIDQADDQAFLAAFGIQP
jgi:hypothetical protein